MTIVTPGGAVIVDDPNFVPGGGTGFTDLKERSPFPATPPANTARLFTVDNGAGLTQLLVKWDSGGTSQLSIEP